MNNRLWGSRVYLAGPMDRVPDGGIVWRYNITPKLQSHGIVVLSPTNKPIDIGIEGKDCQVELTDNSTDEDYDKEATRVRLLRVIDLRMVDLADFLIVYIDPNTHLCGSYEELFTANSTKKPILVMIEGGKYRTPRWLLGTIPHQMIFGNWDDLLEYIRHVDEDVDVEHRKRWTWFKYKEMLPNGI